MYTVVGDCFGERLQKRLGFFRAILFAIYLLRDGYRVTITPDFFSIGKRVEEECEWNVCF